MHIYLPDYLQQDKVVMKRLIQSFICFLCIGVPLSYGQKNTGIQPMTGLTVTVSEKGNKAPVRMATVYIVPAGDTVASAFTFTDKKGIATLKDVPSGKYNVNVQLLGFKPYMKEHILKPLTLERISVVLEEDVQELEGACVTEMGDLVTVKGDTLIYNASSFRTASNASLGDLLKKMPGIEVDKGAVRVNGEPVKRITIEGKTFFFDDQSKALENLPAFIVNKIKVIDKENQGRLGLSKKEKEMDVRLKDEYKEAWFGRASAEGGVSIKDKSSDRFNENTRGLYNAKFYAQYYGDNDAVTLIGGGNNVNANKLKSTSSGLSDIASVGVNYNTSRISGYNTTASPSYDFRNDNIKSESRRTSFLSSGEQLETKRSQDNNSINHTTKAYFKLGTAQYELPWSDGFEIDFNFLYKRNKISTESSSSTCDSSGGELNGSRSYTSGYGNDYSADVKFRSRYFLDDEARHTLSFNGAVRYNGSCGNSEETSLTRYKSSSENRSLLYDDKTDAIQFNGDVNYSFKLSRQWNLYSFVSADFNSSKDKRDAEDAASHIHNEYYSKYATDRTLNLTEAVTAGYLRELGRQKYLNVDFGLSAYEDNIAHFSKAFGTMDNNNAHWVVNAGPDITFGYRDSSWNLAVYTRGKSVVPPLGAASSPVLDISNPIDVSTGNIYLKTGYHQDLNLSFTHGSKSRGRNFVNVRLGGFIDFNELTRASWYDSSAVRYSIPVNAQRPRYNASLNVTYIQPLNKKKSINLTITPKAVFSTGTIYVAGGVLRGLDKESFNYSEMMRWFYGDSNGSEFYSGRSGFIENRTFNLDWSLNADLKCEISDFSIRGGASAANTLTKYSATPDAKVNNWLFNAYAEALWQNKSGWEVEGRFDFNGYKGFSYGYNEPEYLLNLKVAKAIKSFTISLSAYDIFGSAKSFSHRASAEYVEDTYRNNTGRCILVGLSYNFGKWNFVNKMKMQSLEDRNNL